jgi:hypothetical protein
LIGERGSSAPGTPQTSVDQQRSAAVVDVAAPSARRRSWRTGRPARIEVEAYPEPKPSALRRRTGHLMDNLADRTSLAFFVGALLSQVADTVTTSVALSRHSLMEANGLMRAAVTQPAIVGSLKTVAILLVCALAMMRLPARHARLALMLAFGIGVFAPLQNIVQLLQAH